jgi:hypothetical protein
VNTLKINPEKRVTPNKIGAKLSTQRGKWRGIRRYTCNENRMAKTIRQRNKKPRIRPGSLKSSMLNTLEL